MIYKTWHLVLNTTQGGGVPVSSTTGSTLPRSSSSCSNISLSRRFYQKRKTKPFALIQTSPASTHDPGLIMNYLKISPIPSLKDKYLKYFAPPLSTDKHLGLAQAATARLGRSPLTM